MSKPGKVKEKTGKSAAKPAKPAKGAKAKPAAGDWTVADELQFLDQEIERTNAAIAHFYSRSIAPEKRREGVLKPLYVVQVRLGQARKKVEAQRAKGT